MDRPGGGMFHCRFCAGWFDDLPAHWLTVKECGKARLDAYDKGERVYRAFPPAPRASYGGSREEEPWKVEGVSRATWYRRMRERGEKV